MEKKMWGCPHNPDSCDEGPFKSVQGAMGHIRNKHDGVGEPVEVTVDEGSVKTSEDLISVGPVDKDEFKKLLKSVGVAPPTKIPGIVELFFSGDIDDPEHLIQTCVDFRLPPWMQRVLLKLWFKGRGKDVKSYEKAVVGSETKKGGGSISVGIEDSADDIYEDIDRMRAREMKRRFLEKQLTGGLTLDEGHKDGEDGKKVDYILEDGTKLRVTQSELMAWKNWELKKEELKMQKDKKPEPPKKDMVTIPMGPDSLPIEVSASMAPMFLMMTMQNKGLTEEKIATMIKEGSPKNVATPNDVASIIAQQMNEHEKNELINKLNETIDKRDKEITTALSRKGADGYQSDDARLISDGLNTMANVIDKSGGRIHDTVRQFMESQPTKTSTRKKVPEGSGDRLIERLGSGFVEEISTAEAGAA